MPVKDKEKVFNEWAAVIQHKDEIVKASEVEDKLRIKDRQTKYKSDLDQLKSLKQQRAEEERSQDMMQAKA